MSFLFANLRPSLDLRQGGVILQFTAATAGEGVSTAAREFAYFAATSAQLKTLLVDASRSPSSSAIFGTSGIPSIAESVQQDGTFDRAITPVVEGLWAGTLFRGPDSGSASSKPLPELFGLFRRQFDLVVIDGPPVASGQYVHLAPDAADHVILVVQAEKSRPAVVQFAKESLEQAGGRILGVIFNRRKNYIPKFIYRLL